MEWLTRDLWFAARTLAKQRGFLAVAIVTLALGIGGGTAIFSVIDAAILRPLPYPDPDRMVEIHVQSTQRDGRVAQLGPSMADVREWSAAAGSTFAHIGMWRRVFAPVLVDGPELEQLSAREISSAYLGVFGVSPVIGRGVEEAEMNEGAAPVVLLGHSFWQTRFGGDPGVLGRTLRVDNTPATIVGVLPSHFYRDVALWRPLRLTPQMFERRGIGTETLARLQPGITLQRATQALAHASGVVTSLYDVTTRAYRQTANILSAAVTLILFIACINVAGLLIARGASRTPELAVRVSLGATRWTIVRQLLTESVLIALVGGAAGVFIAWMTLDALIANIPMSLPTNAPVAINERVLVFAAALSVATGLMFGLYPAMKLSRVSVKDALAYAGRRHGSALSRRGGQALIAIEVAVAMVLLAAAGLMLRSFTRLLAIDVGLDARAILVMEVTPADPVEEVGITFYRALLERLRQAPALAAVGAIDTPPLGGTSTGTSFVVDGNQTSAGMALYLPGYFEAIGVPLRAGRLPTPADSDASTPVAVVNETAAGRLFADGRGVGRRITLGKSEYEVVAVVGDVRHEGPQRPVRPEIFVRYSGQFARPLRIVARPLGNRTVATQQMRAAVAGVGMRAIVGRIRGGEELLDDRVLTPRRRTVLLSLLGGLGWLLALVGIFGVTAYSVTRRTQEIGVRVAFGATPGKVVRAMVLDVLLPVAVGIIAGLAGAAASTRVIASFLFETTPVDKPTFGAVAVCLLIAAIVAAWVPARRAAYIDPVAALRVE